jgi:uncharacterized protein
MRGQLYPSGFISKIAALAGIWVLSSIFFSVLGFVTLPFVFPNLGGDWFSLFANGIADTPPAVLRYVQVFSATGMFVVPAVVFAYLVSFKNQDYLRIEKPISLGIAILIVFLVVAMVPMVDWLTSAMRQITFPESLQGFQNWLEEAEAANLKIISKMMAGQSVVDLLSNLIVMAVIPAVGEELLFRGVLQPLLTERFKNAALAILLTSIIFAVLHQQFYNFPGLFYISVALGYIRYWTDNLKLCMWAHFVNNAGFVLLAFFTGADPTEASSLPNQWIWVVFSLVGTMILMALIKKTGKPMVNVI